MSELRPAVVLIQPRIPQNVGAIGRVCAATRSSLHIVRPIPFDLSDRSLRRAGMDYLDILDWHIHCSWQECKTALADRRFFFLTSHGSRSFFQAGLGPGDVLVFGSESAGLPEEVRADIGDRGLRLPMPEPNARCLNLATAAAVAVYEQLRQAGEFASHEIE